MFAANEMLSSGMLATNEIDDIENSSGSKPVKPKTRRLESQKLFMSKKPSKSRNSPKFDTKKIGRVL